MMTTNRWRTLDELAGYLKLSHSKLYQMVQAGEVSASKVGSQWRFDCHEIDEWMKSQWPSANDSPDKQSDEGKGGEILCGLQ